MRLRIRLCFFVIVAVGIQQASAQQHRPFALQSNALKRYIDFFNSQDAEEVKNYVPNDQAYEWLSANVPVLDCPDSIIEQTYYYRWWTFRKHLKQTPDGFIFTEFIMPVSHAGKHNAISCALGHHLYEGRWLHTKQYIDEYVSFWLYKDKLEKKPRFHAFSSWVDDAVYNRFLVNGDKQFLQTILPALNADYDQWESERQFPDGMFWQNDVKDGMEESISGGRRVRNIRPTINSYMYGNAVALSAMASLFHIDSLQTKYNKKAADLKTLTRTRLWSDSASFYLVLLEKGKKLSNAREAIGFIPWYFNIPEDDATHAKAWDQLIDTAGFNAPWGQTTAERRHPQFRTHGVGTCEWDGAIWPFATTQTMKGLANFLTRYKDRGKMNAAVYYDELHKYARSHQKNGKPYLGEYQDEKNGYWLKGDDPRSSFYNHSGFCDLVISDLVGLKPRLDNVVELYPLIPKDKWDWFCLDNVLYHGHILAILWDKSGKKYGKGKGLHIYADGKEIYKGKKLGHVLTHLPAK